MPQIETINREPPIEIRTEQSSLSRDGLIALYTGLYEIALRNFETEYELLMRSQENLRRPIHKGGCLYNKGLALLGLERSSDAFYSILLAYVEDTLSAAFDSEDDADRAPAGILLRDGFILKLRLLRDIKNKVREIKSQGRWIEATDPTAVVTDALGPLSHAELFQFCQTRDLRLGGKMPLGFPQPRDRRVFIGTNYDTHAHVIPDIKNAVVSKGYTPVVVAEVSFPKALTHDASLLLLHTCSYAVFDVTSPAGQLMEIERAKDYNVKVLLVRSRPVGRPPHVSQMIKALGFRLRTYNNMSDLRVVVTRFLP